MGYAFDLGSPAARQIRSAGWPDTGIKDRGFDITANLTTDAELPVAERRRAVAELLTSRFGLRTRVEPRDVDAFRLLPVTPGVLGPNLRRVAFNCADPEIRQRDDAPKDGDGRPACRASDEIGTHRSGGSMRDLASMLEIMLMGQRRVIVDATGLSGFFVWEVTTKGLVTTVREQLGLRLEPARTRVNVLVIESIQTPTPN